MIRYSYNQQLAPPAPFVHVSVRNFARDLEHANLPAQLDTGADISAIPHHVAEELELAPSGEIEIAGFGAKPEIRQCFTVEIAIRTFSFVRVRILTDASLRHVLLGRDVINRYPVHLIGPQLALEVEEV